MKILEVNNLGKQYRLGATGSGTLSHDLNRWFAKIRGKEDPYRKLGDTNDRTSSSKSDYVWALRNISFELNQGDVLGVIGRNGAGKSTLLKILSGITLPSEGSIKYYGRMASLLEVGTGFHPELTGRENVFLNGAILGMTKTEIKTKFDEIVDFSGCAAYIDTPVKRYSSGMLVRLGFSVAAHLEPEILVVDEVLAVGDLEFQQKCLGKMNEVSRSGRTILFVSHNMQAVSKLCNKGLYLKNGLFMQNGTIQEVIENYIQTGFLGDHKYTSDDTETKEAKVISASLTSCANIEKGVFSVFEPFKIKVRIKLNRNLNHFIAAVGFKSVLDENVNTTWSAPLDLSEGLHEFEFINDLILLSAGSYSVTIGLSSSERVLEYLEDTLTFSIIESTKFKGDSRIIRIKGTGLILNQLNCVHMQIN